MADRILERKLRYILFVCVFMCVCSCVSAVMGMWRSGDHFQELVLSSHHVGLNSNCQIWSTESPVSPQITSFKSRICSILGICIYMCVCVFFLINFFFWACGVWCVCARLISGVLLRGSTLYTEADSQLNQSSPILQVSLASLPRGTLSAIQL